jgi:hypothetical protein
MESEVLDFLTKLATDPVLYSAWLRDPDGTMRKHGLDEKVRQALASGDARQIHRTISAKAAADEKAAEESMARAREVAAIIESDPNVALWVQNHYYQTLLAWLAGAGSNAPPADGRGTSAGYA